MAMYEAGVSRAALAAAGWAVQLRSASSDRLRVREIGITLTTAVATEIGLIRSLTVGATFTSTVPQAEDPADGPATANLDTGATTAPTIAGTPIYLRRIQLPATVGAGIIWQWDAKDPLMLPVSAGLLLWGLSTTTGAMDIYVKHEE